MAILERVASVESGYQERNHCIRTANNHCKVIHDLQWVAHFLKDWKAHSHLLTTLNIQATYTLLKTAEYYR